VERLVIVDAASPEEAAMRAMTVTEYGAIPTVVELPTPQPDAGQVLLRMRAAGTNPMDAQLAAGLFRPAPAVFPMVLGADGAGVVEQLGDGAGRFAPGDEVFGQLLIAPVGSAGTYAEYVAVTEEAPLARVPAGMDPVLTASLPTAGGTGLALVESLGPPAGTTVLIVGAAGGVGSFATQFAVQAGAHVIAVVRAAAAERMRGYGVAETVDHTEVSVPDAVRQNHPQGIDVLIDLASDADGFAALASLVRPAGSAVTTRSVADADSLAGAGVAGINFAVTPFLTSELLARLADALVGGRIVAPPITRISLEQAQAALRPAEGRRVEGKTVIAF
jgi:NADPH2:quinone reductase